MNCWHWPTTCVTRGFVKNEYAPNLSCSIVLTLQIGLQTRLEIALAEHKQQVMQTHKDVISAVVRHRFYCVLKPFFLICQP